MPFWYYDKKEIRNSPSSQDGIDFDTESRYRKEGTRFIIDTGTKMDLGYNTMATGVVYFHRFYMFHSFRTFPRYVTACCCLLLAGKVEETPKKCKDIIKTAKGLLPEAKFAAFGCDPKEEVLTLERILLQTIKFDLQVDHPYTYLLRYAKCLKGDKNKLQKMVQMAWTFVNDSLCTTLCLQWEPEVIAVALMYLSGKLSKFEVIDWNGRTSKHTRWWDMFIEDVTLDLLEDICHQVLDLYSQPTSTNVQDSPPLVAHPKTPERAKTPPPLQPPPQPPLLPKNGEVENAQPIKSLAASAIPRPEVPYHIPYTGAQYPAAFTAPIAGPPTTMPVIPPASIPPVHPHQPPVIPHQPPNAPHIPSAHPPGAYGPYVPQPVPPHYANIPTGGYYPPGPPGPRAYYPPPNA
uniref:Cyclin-K n=1 Tax=Xenopsylla cheopis TaxID=163159 RepID=A0A6M2DMG6_XENCH